MLVGVCFFFFFSSRRRHTRCREVSWARRCVQETALTLPQKVNKRIMISVLLEATQLNLLFCFGCRVALKLSPFFRTAQSTSLKQFTTREYAEVSTASTPIKKMPCDLNKGSVLLISKELRVFCDEDVQELPDSVLGRLFSLSVILSIALALRLICPVWRVTSIEILAFLQELKLKNAIEPASVCMRIGTPTLTRSHVLCVLSLIHI
eukprot:TRINITY_DN5565_c0_g1_i1.p2 TRINITY_DN5565_c0_g1~~TRINITY_DN5565_c0_g1_i1.p2  ORF type:complete len:207 (+),score=28.47 TRINITY_DN5565_c0_g1_i1:28-648(+)